MSQSTSAHQSVHKTMPPPWDGYTLKHSYYYIAYILYLVAFALLALGIETDVTTVFLSTFPILLSVVLYSVLASLHARRRIMLIATLIVPLFASLFFTALAMSGVSARVNDMDIGAVIIWQLLASYFLLVISWIFVEHSSKSEHVAQARAQHGQVHPAMYSQHAPAHAHGHQVSAHINHNARGLNPYYQQMVKEYAHAAHAHAHRATQLESELTTARVAMSTANANTSREQEYRRQIDALQTQLSVEKQAANESAQKNADYEKHISQLQTTVSKLKDKLEVSETNFTARLRGVEDKAKAINFVIGRVYSDRNGGNATIRSTLNIDRELYNAFSEMSGDVTPENRKKLVSVLEQIQKKILALELPEHKLFKLSSRAKLQRDVNGTDSVLVVLSKNDTDPVVDYFVEAKEICSNMLEYLSKTK